MLSVSKLYIYAYADAFVLMHSCIYAYADTFMHTVKYAALCKNENVSSYRLSMLQNV